VKHGLGLGDQMTDRITTSAGRGEGSVLVVTHLFPSDDREIRGPWVAEQVDALGGLLNVRVLCCSPTASDRSAVRPSGVPVTYRSIRTRFGRGRIGLLASSVRYDRALAAYLRSAPSVSLIHAHFGIPDAIVAYRQAEKAGLPLVVTLHGDDAFKVLPRRDPIGRAMRHAVAGARAVICVSSAMSDAVRLVMPRVDPVVIPNGFDDSLFMLSDKPRDLGLLFVGMFVPVKNLDVLLRAYASVHDRVAMPLTLAGDGPLRAALESQARELGVAGSVRFVGAQSREEVAALMGRAAALVLPSRSEGWPLVIAESLGCGTPVVASRVGGIPEIVASDAGGILVTPGDVGALAEGLVEVVRRPLDPHQVAGSSRARPWSVQARRIAAVYESVLGVAGDGTAVGAPRGRGYPPG
jgi:glycosyltransferase involved in cell wall biosynthesis